MIARVRIAPVERWCDEARTDCGSNLAGLQIDILTHSCRSADKAESWKCGGREWLTESTWTKRRCCEIGIRNYAHMTICEHMLEMD